MSKWGIDSFAPNISNRHMPTLIPFELIHYIAIFVWQESKLSSSTFTGKRDLI